METLNTKSIGSFVADDYRTATVFQKYGIDFCCKGGKSLDEVCESRNLDTDVLLKELAEAANTGNGPQADFQLWPLDLLADYIEKKHHRYIQQHAPALLQYLEKLCKVHGAHHPELFEINKEFTAADSELTSHMKKEEQILFPYIRNMVALQHGGGPFRQAGFGTVKNPIAMMMQEHDTEGERFSRMASLSGNYTPPADGCTTYRVAFAMLKEFEADLHLHIHLENNMLFPKAAELEKSLSS